jgi:Zn-dependent peptidase ImmA (M78 family)
VNVPNKPRYEYAKHIGRTFFNKLNVESYPIDPIQIVYQMKWKFEIDNLYGEEGYTFYNPKTNKYCIVIDDTQRVKKQRCKFTIAHEIGHIILGHHTSFEVSNLTDMQFKILDLEADIVAGEILMPYNSIKKTSNNNIMYLANKYDVSYSAMKTRLKFLNLYDLYVEDELNANYR